jgi:hypothetical protein
MSQDTSESRSSQIGRDHSFVSLGPGRPMECRFCRVQARSVSPDQPTLDEFLLHGVWTTDAPPACTKKTVTLNSKAGAE